MRLIVTLAMVLAVVMLPGGCSKQKPTSRTPQETTGEADYRVNFTRENPTSTPVVTVALNGVPVNMLWDTGATITCISGLEFVTLIKNNVIDSERDYLGVRNMEVADGSVSKVPSYRVNEVSLTDRSGKQLTVYNVEVVVVEDPLASLLLGQNVMNELPEYTFNEQDNTIDFVKSR